MSLTHELLLETWIAASIIPIPKPDEVIKCRPICLTPTVGKMLKCILLNCLLHQIGKLDVGILEGEEG